MDIRDKHRFECYICKSIHLAEKTNCFKDWPLGKLLYCSNCEIMFLRPQPDTKVLNSEYSNYFYRRSAGVESFKKSYYQKFIATLKLDFNHKSILDLGCGEGTLLSVLSEKYPSAKLLGVDPLVSSWESKDCKIKFVNSSIEAWLEQSQNQIRFDYIFLMDVIEHLRHPYEVILSLGRDYLKAKGQIIGTTPNVKSFSALMLGSSWPHIKLEHLFYFSPKSISLLFSKAHLHMDMIRIHVKTYPLEAFLNIGSGFGPETFKRVCRYLRKHSPDLFLNCHISIPCGEIYWMGSKE